MPTELTEERKRRLQQWRSVQRIAAESTEEREDRLQQLRSAQQQRIAVESKQREDRLQQLINTWFKLRDIPLNHVTESTQKESSLYILKALYIYMRISFFMTKNVLSTYAHTSRHAYI